MYHDVPTYKRGPWKILEDPGREFAEAAGTEATELGDLD